MWTGVCFPGVNEHNWGTCGHWNCEGTEHNLCECSAKSRGSTGSQGSPTGESNRGVQQGIKTINSRRYSCPQFHARSTSVPPGGIDDLIGDSELKHPSDRKDSRGPSDLLLLILLLLFLTPDLTGNLGAGRGCVGRGNAR